MRMHHEHEYNAIRNSAALIDISPLMLLGWARGSMVGGNKKRKMRLAVAP